MRTKERERKGRREEKREKEKERKKKEKERNGKGSGEEKKAQDVENRPFLGEISRKIRAASRERNEFCAAWLNGANNVRF